MNNTMRKNILFSVMFLASIIFASLHAMKRDVIVSAGSDGIKLWDAQTGKDITKGELADRSYLKTYKKYVGSIAFNNKGTKFVSAGNSLTGDQIRINRIKLWDVETGNEIKTENDFKIAGKLISKPINCLAFNPKNQYVFVSAGEGKIIVWGAKSGKKIKTFRGNRHGVNSIAFNKQGTKMVSVGYNGEIIIWNVKTRKKITQGQVLENNTNAVFSAAFHPTKRNVIVFAFYNGVKLWDTKKRKYITKGAMENARDAFYSVFFNSSGTKIIAGGKKGIKIWNANTGRDITPGDLKRYNGDVAQIALTSKEDKIISAGYEMKRYEMKLWSMADGKDITKRDMRTYRKPVNAIAFKPIVGTRDIKLMKSQLRKAQKGVKYPDVRIRTENK